MKKTAVAVAFLLCLGLAATHVAHAADKAGQAVMKYYPVPIYRDNSGEFVPATIYLGIKSRVDTCAPFDLANQPSEGVAAKLCEFIKAVQAGDKAKLLSMAKPTEREALAERLEKSLGLMQKYYQPPTSGRPISVPLTLELGNLRVFALDTEDSKDSSYKLVQFETNTDGTLSWAGLSTLDITSLIGNINSIFHSLKKGTAHESLSKEPEGYVRVPVPNAKSGETGEPVAWLYVRLREPEGDTVVFSDGAYVEGKTTCKDKDTEKVLAFYRDFCKAFSEIPLPKGFSASEELTHYLSFMSEKSAIMAVKNFSAKSDGISDYRNKMVMPYRKVAAVIDAKPLYIVFYTGRRDKEFGDFHFYDMVERTPDGKLQIVNHHHGSSFDKLFYLDLVVQGMKDAATKQFTEN